jgi:adenylate cyclase
MSKADEFATRGRADVVAAPSTTGIGTALESTGMQDPRELAQDVPLVDRAFAFIDLCGFTRYTATYGEHAAIDLLVMFRATVREVAARRGVVIAKWLGDGVMLVGTDPGPTIAATAEVLARSHGHALAVRAGTAHGGVLLFEGDDYVGRPVNLAARFCQAAQPEELLAVGYPLTALPAWMRVLGTREVTLAGLGLIRQVQRLGLVSDVELRVAPSPLRPEA